MAKPFVHFAVSSRYSLLESALSFSQIIETCRRHGMPAVAVADRGNMFGVMEFAIEASRQGIQPIIGCLLNVSMTDMPQDTPYPLPLYVQNEEGWRNLVRMVGESYSVIDDGFPPQVVWPMLAEHHRGLLAFSGDRTGAVQAPFFISEGRTGQEHAERLASLFSGRFYMQIARHGYVFEKKIEATLLNLARHLECPPIAVHHSYYHTADFAPSYNVLRCIDYRCARNAMGDREYNASHTIYDPDAMHALFHDIPECCEQTILCAQRCSWFPQPISPTLPSFTGTASEDEQALLHAQARQGLEKRLQESPVLTSPEEAKPYHERLAYELEMICSMGYAGYFLIVADFIGWAKRQHIAVGPGRGSGAGSIVAWALNITDLDPIRLGLLFERFLNPERISMPDFDIDFCQERRDDVIRYVRDKYGPDHVAHIITFGTLKARAALRDVGRILNMPYGQVDRMCKMVPFQATGDTPLKQIVAEEPALQSMATQDPNVASMLDIAHDIQGLYRHASTHAAGIVISDKPLSDTIPLYRDKAAQLPATQYSMKYVEMAGLIKFDFLGLKTLTIIDNCVALIKDAQGHAIAIQHIPLDDEPTYALMAQGDTIGVFQLESDGMRRVLCDLKPDRFEEIIALISLYRPGPMDNIPTYVARKHGREPVTYMDERLTAMLQETYGVMIYQEQVMQIAQALAGFTLAKADILRKAMGKKDPAIMAGLQHEFMVGARNMGLDDRKARRIFQMIEKFAGYGFNKSHAAAYALIAYQTAWLKTHYPVEFFAASMSQDMGNQERLRTLKEDAERMTISVLPPHVNHSCHLFSVESVVDKTSSSKPKNAVRYALTAIKNVGAESAKAIEEERKKNGLFSDMVDFARRCHPPVLNRRMLEAMIYTGCFDSLENHRRKLFDVRDNLLHYAHQKEREARLNQETLFSCQESGEEDTWLSSYEGPDWSLGECLAYEFDMLGFFFSDHPLVPYEAFLEKNHVIPYRQVKNHVAQGASKHIVMAGAVLKIRQRRARESKKRLVFLHCSDQGDAYDVLVDDTLWQAQHAQLTEGVNLMMNVTAYIREDKSIRLVLKEMSLLGKEHEDEAQGHRHSANKKQQHQQASEAKTSSTHHVAHTAIDHIAIHIRQERELYALRRHLDRASTGQTHLSLCLHVETTMEGEGKTIRLAFPHRQGYMVDAELLSKLRTDCAHVDVSRSKEPTGTIVA
ncbi:MAG: DNA polymerase III subunit alpha [Alphaproteobacteria bacterium GM7ARS4]|nr:DNA polymerase III subunit alpha [Alphaproteobacteria bacterium GM7ARS4]